MQSSIHSGKKGHAGLFEMAFVKGTGKLNNSVIVLVDVVNALSKEEFTKIQTAQAVKTPAAA